MCTRSVRLKASAPKSWVEHSARGDKAEQHESKVEEDAAFKIMDNSDNSDSDDEMPDAGLLTMQKQLSIPRVQVSEFNENEEKMHLDVDGMKLAEVADSPLLVGMMSSGAEAKMFKKYS